MSKAGCHCTWLSLSHSALPSCQVYGDKALPYVVPQNNVRIECPISTVDMVLARWVGWMGDVLL